MLDLNSPETEFDVLDGLAIRLRAGDHSALMMVSVFPAYRKADLGNCEFRTIHIEIEGQLGRFEGQVAGEIGDDWREILAGMSDDELLDTLAPDLAQNPTPASRTFLEELWRPCMAQFAPDAALQHSPAPRR